jgi:hypothetical protein
MRMTDDPDLAVARAASAALADLSQRLDREF